VRLDGKAVRPISKYFGEFNVVLFAPEDLQVPRASPAARRRFLDRAVFNRHCQYLAEVQSYERVVKNRNALLRDLAERRHDPKKQELLEVFDSQLAQLGAGLICRRLGFLAEIRDPFGSAFERITHTGLGVGVHYQTVDEFDGLSLEQSKYTAVLLELLKRHRARDLARGTSSVGPHRDDVRFTLDGHDASSFASQGQLRALVLAWKTAEMDLLQVGHGEPPVLLLDDVSSELDPTRNEYLFEFLKSRRSQCFITTTHPGYVLLDSDRVDYQVNQGVVSFQSGF
ncbi:MAG: DNA replication and repair protein RecF, partial [Proteobacteria bacterium]|nr:DNA replication and repair protein RecF [Pseudomonadota bacterium]